MVLQGFWILCPPYSSLGLCLYLVSHAEGLFPPWLWRTDQWCLWIFNILFFSGNKRQDPHDGSCNQEWKWIGNVDEAMIACCHCGLQPATIGLCRCECVCACKCEHKGGISNQWWDRKQLSSSCWSSNILLPPFPWCIYFLTAPCCLPAQVSMCMSVWAALPRSCWSVPWQRCCKSLTNHDVTRRETANLKNEFPLSLLWRSLKV